MCFHQGCCLARKANGGCLELDAENAAGRPLPIQGLAGGGCVGLARKVDKSGVALSQQRPVLHVAESLECRHEVRLLEALLQLRSTTMLGMLRGHAYHHPNYKRACWIERQEESLMTVTDVGHHWLDTRLSKTVQAH